MSVKRSFVSLTSDNLEMTKSFYASLFGWRVDFDSDWFVHLQSTNNASIELGILRRDHDIVPMAIRNAPTGMMITIVVEDVDAVYAEATRRSLDVLEAPRNLFYGQRRMLLRDPNGVVVDVSSDCPPSPQFLASLGG